MSHRRRDMGSVRLRMDRQPSVRRITDPSLVAGKRKEIDNVMRKARASSSDYWDKKLLEVEEKDPNRWRHTGYKKLYIEGDTSSDNDQPPAAQQQHVIPSRDNPQYHRGSSGVGSVPSRGRSPPRSRSRNRRTPPLSPAPLNRRRSPRSPPLPPPPSSSHHQHNPVGSGDTRRRSTRSPVDHQPVYARRRSPDRHQPAMGRRRAASPDHAPARRRPRSPFDPPAISSGSMRRRLSRSPPPIAKPRTPAVMPRSKRPPSPPQPPKPRPSRAATFRDTHQPTARSPSNSTLSSCSDDSCTVCSPKQAKHDPRLRPTGDSHMREANPREVHPRETHLREAYPRESHTRSLAERKQHSSVRQAPPPRPAHVKPTVMLTPSSLVQPVTGGSSSSSSSHHHVSSSTSGRIRPHSPPVRDAVVKRKSTKRKEEKISRHLDTEPISGPPSPVPVRKHKKPTVSVATVGDDPRLLKSNRPPEPFEPTPPPPPPPKKGKTDKTSQKIRTKIKIEGEKRKKPRRSSSSGSDNSSSSASSLPTFTAATRLTLSERFGKMAQWSVDRSNMENMRITKDSAGGALKVMIEEGVEGGESPRRSYSPAPPGHFPEELALTAPSGMLSWDDVRVRYEYYKSRGYLRDLDLEDYIKWEEWWYRYQEWLKQERYYEFWERQQMHRRRRKKIPILNRLN